MRIMGLDVGSKTVGVAISDAFGWTAQGLKTIQINEAIEEFGFNQVGDLIGEYEINKIVVGLPKNMNGTIGPRGEACQIYADELEKRFSIPAERILLEADVSRKKRKKVIDKMAAAMILQGYLDSQN